MYGTFGDVFYDFKVSPMTLDLTVNFLASSHPGELEAVAKITKFGGSMGFSLCRAVSGWKNGGYFNLYG
ncbi:MAG: hypothetical protein Ct9H90mP4_09590 [Gammaproteobacteria bacterium]|nr:MAG: hypothetical protein Ct9H90mP4_09590 [Gammaproteobacteria bacterium]